MNGWEALSLIMNYCFVLTQMEKDGGPRHPHGMCPGVSGYH